VRRRKSRRWWGPGPYASEPRRGPRWRARGS